MENFNTDQQIAWCVGKNRPRCTGSLNLQKSFLLPFILKHQFYTQNLISHPGWMLKVIKISALPSLQFWQRNVRWWQSNSLDDNSFWGSPTTLSFAIRMVKFHDKQVIKDRKPSYERIAEPRWIISERWELLTWFRLLIKCLRSKRSCMHIRTCERWNGDKEREAGDWNRISTNPNTVWFIHPKMWVTLLHQGQYEMRAMHRKSKHWARTTHVAKSQSNFRSYDDCRRVFLSCKHGSVPLSRRAPYAVCHV